MISTKDLDYNYIIDIFSKAHTDRKIEKYFDSLNVCLWFQEPSTRTQLSFDRAIKDIGGNVTVFPEFSAMEKGESFTDTIKTIEALGFHILVIRSKKRFLPHEASQKSKYMKIINAGDGINEHPTQALADLYTMVYEFRDIVFGYEFQKLKLDGLKVAIIGDIIRSRVAHSLIPLLDLFDVDIRLLEKEPSLDSHYKFDSLQEVINWKPDVIYMLRDQIERGSYSHQKVFTLTQEHLQGAKIMHPGPINIGKEILTPEIVDHKDSLICQQVKNGVRIKKAILKKVVLDDKSNT